MAVRFLMTPCIYVHHMYISAVKNASRELKRAFLNMFDRADVSIGYIYFGAHGGYVSLLISATVTDTSDSKFKADPLDERSFRELRE